MREPRNPPSSVDDFLGSRSSLAQAIQYEDMLRRGVGKNFADLARLACLSRERISQLARLLWLAPDIQKKVLSLPRTPSGRFPVGEPALRRIAPRGCAGANSGRCGGN